MTGDKDLGRSRPATIKDVAQLAGVSRAAVSKVIRNAYGVSVPMRERVTAAIDELGYRPRVAARAMRGSTSTIGVQVPQLDNGFIARILTGIVATLSASNFQMIMAPMADPVDGVRALESLVDRQVDGIIAIAPGVPQAWLDGLGRRVSLVQIGQHDDPEHYDVVTGDDSLGGRLATEHLLQRGHTRIVHLTTDERMLMEPATDPHPLRARAFEEVMRAHGLVPEVVRIASLADVPRVTGRLLDRAEPPTAVFTGHDALALEVLSVAAERQIGPAALAVIGYDDVPLADHPLIGLSTIDQAGDRLGVMATRLLLERIRGRTDVVRHQMTPVLRIRRTTATSASGGAEHSR